MSQRPAAPPPAAAFLAAAAAAWLVLAAVSTGTGPGRPLARPGPGADCRTCHETDELFSHPVDVVPGMAVPAELPLPNGRMTCLTCHEEGSADAHAAAPADRRHTPALRGGDSPLGLCTACHGGSGLDDIHAVGLARAHVRWPETGTSRSPAARPDALDALDTHTAGCMSCHDGALALGASYEIGRPAAPRRPAGLLERGHPVGVDYRRSRGGSLRPEHALDRRVRLFDGQVGCGSCHSPFSPNRDMLVLPNDRSALCLECHDF